MFDIHVLPILSDNYAFIIRSGDQVGVIDPGEAQPFIDFLDDKGWDLDVVINTHHHWDHTDGNQGLIDRYHARWAAPAECGQADEILEEGTPFQFGDTEFQIIHGSGHTKGHVSLYSAADHVLFSGDNLFAMGCGRLFEDTAEAMFDGLQKLKSLPSETLVYFGHEYTASNAKFAAHLFPDNQDILARCGEVSNQIQTIPTRLADELKTNPFLLAETVEQFTDYRKQKDDF
jgi:hydroxyacylglutathione hydrolase